MNHDRENEGESEGEIVDIQGVVQALYIANQTALTLISQLETKINELGGRIEDLEKHVLLIEDRHIPHTL